MGFEATDIDVKVVDFNFCYLATAGRGLMSGVIVDWTVTTCLREVAILDSTLWVFRVRRETGSFEARTQYKFSR